MKRKLEDFLELEIIDEPAFANGSVDIINQYNKHFLGEGTAKSANNSTHGIRLIKHNKIIDSCLVQGFAGSTSVNETSFLIDSDRIVICCANLLFCISIPALNLLWKQEVDSATAFQIFKKDNDYIVHGEMMISRVDQQGNIVWQFGGRDIFVNIDDNLAFKLKSDHIVLHDFFGYKYLIGYDGKEL